MINNKSPIVERMHFQQSLLKLELTACNIANGPVASEFGIKRQWDMLNRGFASKVLGKVLSHFVKQSGGASVSDGRGG